MSKTPSYKQQCADAKVLIALHICHTIKADYSYGTQSFKYRFVTVDKIQGHVRNPSASDGKPFDGFDDLSFRCQASSDMCDGKPYGYSIEYHDVGRVEARDAERMTAMFKRLQKIEAAFPVRPETFGQYVALICHGLGVECCIQDRDGGNGWHHETEHQQWNGTDIQWLVDRQIDTFLTTHADAMAASRR